MNVRTRFAPSPTGYLHLGGARTALFNWLYAKHHNGDCLLRIEDTDRERSSQQATDAILESLAWLGIDSDQPPIFQSQRTKLYQEAVDLLLSEGQAYYCCCTKEHLEEMRARAITEGKKPRYAGTCRDLSYPKQGNATNTTPVVRFKNPQQGCVVIDDLIQGRVTFENTELDDLVLLRSDGSPTYNLTVVVDDAEMQITHVIRGDDHLNNTPRQMNLYEALGKRLPKFAHIPLILGGDRKRLSKRDGADNLLSYRSAGILPEAMLNYLVRLGWSHADQEIFSIKEMVMLFDTSHINKAAAVFDRDKLHWFNQHYLQSIDSTRLANLMLELSKEKQIIFANTDPIFLQQLADVQKKRYKTVDEILEGSRIFLGQDPIYDQDAVKKHFPEQSRALFLYLMEQLAALEDWSSSRIHQLLKQIASERSVGFGKLAQPLRIAVTGSLSSPSIDVTLALLGKEIVLKRMHDILECCAKGDMIA